jgi:hypothetical protein
VFLIATALPRVFTPVFLCCGVLTGAVCAQAANSSAPAPAAAQPTFTRSEVVAILANSRRIVSPRGIEELSAVSINGIPQYLGIRGKDARNPILLFIHGGPASPEMPYSYTFQTPWEDYFTVVEWDQRGTGKTFAASDPSKISDVEEAGFQLRLRRVGAEPGLLRSRAECDRQRQRAHPEPSVARSCRLRHRE